MLDKRNVDDKMIGDKFMLVISSIALNDSFKKAKKAHFC